MVNLGGPHKGLDAWDFRLERKRISFIGIKVIGGEVWPTLGWEGPSIPPGLKGTPNTKGLGFRKGWGWPYYLGLRDYY